MTDVQYVALVLSIVNMVFHTWYAWIALLAIGWIIFAIRVRNEYRVKKEFKDDEWLN